MVIRDTHTLVIAVLGLGEAGSVIARDLVAAGVHVRGYDPAVTAAGPIIDTASEAEAARGAHLVLSVNSAKAAVDAFKAGLAGLRHDKHDKYDKYDKSLRKHESARPDVLWADLNTASPGTKRQLAELAEQAGIPFADVAMMAPVPGRGLRVPMLASGTGAARYAAVLGPLGADIEVLDGPAGLAASRKLLRSVFYKGMAASIVEALEAARAAGQEQWLQEHIAAELAASDAVTVERITDGTRKHAVRRTAEMEAAADMLTELGVPPLMASASRALHERLATGKKGSETLRERPERLGQRLEGIRLGVVREVHDDQVHACVAVGGGRRDGGPQAGVRIHANVDRTSDLVHVPADRGAVPGQDFLQLEPLLRALGDGVPLLRPERHRTQRALLAAAADGDRRMRPLHRFRLAPGVGEPDVLPGERGRGLAQQPDDGLDALVEPVEPLPQRRQVDPVGVALHLVPPGAQTEFQPPAGDDVHGRGHVGQHRRVPVDHAGHLAADPDSPGGLGHRRQHRPGLEVGSGQVASQRIEMVPVPGRLEQGNLVRREPGVTYLFPGLMLGPRLDREAHADVLS
jgi:3-hydroxyisobutyrate dehydrogenase-like beta-hydroxyacid dehydrogenase